MNKIWFNDRLIDRDEALVNVLSSTAQFGLSVFEGVRSYVCADGKRRVFKLQEHLNRLSKSHEILEMSDCVHMKSIRRGIESLSDLFPRDVDIAFRIILSEAEDVSWHGTGNTVLIIAPKEMPTRTYQESRVSLSFSSYFRISNDLLPEVKCGANYINSRYAKREAISRGFDDAIMFNREGFMSEGTGSCVFIVNGGELITSRISDGILNSITRDTLIDIAERLGIKVVERKVSKYDILTSSEVFLVGTAVEVTGVHKIENRTIRLGPIGKLLYTKYQDYVRHV
jgi:branched-chain amino acid aminotransferase